MNNTLYLAYPCLGKTFYLTHSKGKVIEFPIFSKLIDEKYLFPYQDLLAFGSQSLSPEREKKYLMFILNDLYETYPGLIILGPGIPSFYEKVRKTPDLNVITLIPGLGCLKDFYDRWRIRDTNPGDHNNKLISGQTKSWEPWHAFFEEAAKTDPNIIFTKPGEYLTDYIDMETGQFKYPKLLKI